MNTYQGNKAELITQNLYRFYSIFMEYPEYISYNDRPEMKWVKAKSGYWPYHIFNVDFQPEHPESIIKELNIKINKKQAPHVLVIENPEKITELPTLLRTYKFLPVFRWEGMALDLSQASKKEADHSRIQVKRINDPELLQSWLDIANNSLFHEPQLTHEIFTLLLARHDISLYIGYIDKIPVATAMIFINNNIAGLYLVSTLKEYRNQGMGTAITNKIICDMQELSLDNIILHATPQGEKLYSKFGFQKYCIFDIFWKI